MKQTISLLLQRFLSNSLCIQFDAGFKPICKTLDRIINNSTLNSVEKHQTNIYENTFLILFGKKKHAGLTIVLAQQFNQLDILFKIIL